MKSHFRGRRLVERHLHRVETRHVQRKVDHGDNRKVHLKCRVGSGRNVQLSVRRPQRLSRRIYPAERERMRSNVFHAALQPHDEMSPRMKRRKSADMKRVKYAEYVELSFLGKVGTIGEYGEGDVHARKVAGLNRERLVYAR